MDLNAKYNLAGYNYTLRDLGGGFAMLDGAVNVLDYVSEDYMVLANYISGFENSIVKASNSPLLVKYPNLLLDYSEVTGSGRIELVTDSNSEDNPLTNDINNSFVFIVCIVCFGAYLLCLNKKKYYK